MKIRIQYDNQSQTLELNDKEAEQLCISLSLDPCTADEKAIQDAFDIQYNKPEYNSWHKHDRHTDSNPNIKCMNGHKGYVINNKESDDDDFFTKFVDSNATMPDFEYEDICKVVNHVLTPHHAKMFIAICLDGMTMTDYGKKIGSSKQLIYKQLKSSKKKLAKYFLENGLL